MALKILDDTMTSDQSPHTGRLVAGEQHTWEVSWLPGWHLNRKEAITALVLADATASGDIHPGHRNWPHVRGWANELGLTGDEALGLVANPPRWTRQPEEAAGSHYLDTELEWRNLQRFERAWDDPEWPWPEPETSPDWEAGQ